MTNARQTPDYRAIRRKKPSGLIICGAIVSALAIAMFLGVAFMWGVGATWWGPLSPSTFSLLFVILMGSIPTGVLGLILLIVGIIRRQIPR